MQPPDASSPPHPLQKAIDAGVISWNGKKPVLPAPVTLRGEGKLISDLVETAGRFAAAHGLHLASAEPLIFASYDRRLNQAAQLLQLQVLA